jgi:hypothetical protein
MYIIINESERTCTKVTGEFPEEGLSVLLDKKQKIVVINMYDNNVMVPVGKTGAWSWESYSFPDGTFRGL